MTRLLPILLLAASCHGATGDAAELAIIRDVARMEHLTPGQTALLLAIRRAENGPQGCEFGFAVHRPHHPSRRFRCDAARSLRCQARWTARKIKREYRGDVAAFARGWCADGERETWVLNVSAVERRAKP